MPTDQEIAQVVPTKASPKVLAEAEAMAFMRNTHEYFKTEKNSQVIMSYMLKEKLLLIYDNFCKAYEEMLRAGKLVVPPTPEEFVKLSAAESKKWTDRYPEIIEHYQKLAALEPAAPAPKQRAYSALDYAPIDPKLVGYDPPRKEWVLWTADKLRAWQIANPGAQLR